MNQSSASDIEIAALDATEIRLEPWSWPFTVERREQIAAHFAALQRVRSGIWNGRILLLRSFAIEAGVLRGTCFETDFASFCAWRDWGFPDASICNVFSAAALRSADGAFLLGEMAASTANAGRIYFPCGTPEPADVDAAGYLDLAGSVSRELLEETGLAIGELKSAPGWTMVRNRCYLALLRRVTSPLGAAELRARIIDHLAREQRPEFADIHIVRSPADFEQNMPPFVVEFIKSIWRQ